MLLYAITDRISLDESGERSEQKLVDLCAKWASKDLDFIQIREKHESYGDLLQLAGKIVGTARRIGSGTRILINADLGVSTAIALETGADGVHIPGGRSQDELVETIATIRSQLARRHSANRPNENEPVISVACHTAGEVRAARRAGATMALFAPVFEKALPGQASLPGKGIDALAEACRAGREDAESPGLPVLALGGVTLDNAAQCADAGAAGIAAIRLFLEEAANPARDWRSLRG